MTDPAEYIRYAIHLKRYSALLSNLVIENSESFETEFCNGGTLISCWFGATIKIYYFLDSGEQITDEISYDDIESWIQTVCRS